MQSSGADQIAFPFPRGPASPGGRSAGLRVSGCFHAMCLLVLQHGLDED